MIDLVWVGAGLIFTLIASISSGLCWWGGFRQRQKQETKEISELKKRVVVLDKCTKRTIDCKNLRIERDKARRRELKQMCKTITDIQTRADANFKSIYPQLTNIAMFMGRVDEHMKNVR